jgi:MYXO-CTERM domain-containing protein
MTNSSLSELGRSRSSAASLVSLLCVAAMAIVLLASGRAFASSYAIKTPEVTENSGEWHIKVRIDLSRAPSMMHTPMRFTFSKDVVDERAIMTQGAEPVHHRMVVDTPAKQIVSMDVDFADASGKVYKSTVFEFDLQRAKGYFEAGEYTVALAGQDGDVGGAQKITLKGDNPPVYRGSMDFTSKDNKQKGPKIQKVDNGMDGGSGAQADNDTSSSAAPMSTDVAPVGTAPGMVPGSAFNKTSEEEAVQDHPKGCGCVAAGLEEGSAAGGTAILGLGMAVVRRRRK